MTSDRGNAEAKSEERMLAGVIFRSESETKIIRSLTKTEKRFSQLQKELKMTTGNLNYHLLKLKSTGLVMKEGKTGYALSEAGRKIAKKYL
jgi:predicted transcriptional regulator